MGLRSDSKSLLTFGPLKAHNMQASTRASARKQKVPLSDREKGKEK